MGILPITEINSVVFKKNLLKAELKRKRPVFHVMHPPYARDLRCGSVRDKNHKLCINCPRQYLTLDTYVLQFLHVLFPPLPAFKSCYLVSFSSNPSLLFLLSRKLARNENKRKLLYVTLNDTRYTHHGKPQISISIVLLQPQNNPF